MTLDTKKFPMLGDPSNPPTCKECGARLERLNSLEIWQCSALTPDDCGNEDAETDAELDNRLTSEAEAAYERQQERASGFLSADECAASLHASRRVK